MVDNLALELASLRHGDHLCLPYDSDSECDDVIAPFIGEGLARGERCLYLIEADQREALLKMLAAAGVNAGRALERGSLWLRTPEEIYFRSGTFDPDDTLAVADELVARALADGYTGLRASGEIVDPAAHGIPWQSVFSYEVRFNERFARRPLVALCRYHRPDSPPTMIADALRTHPTAIVGGRVCHNPYYEKPDIALATDDDAARVEWMLRRLRRGSADHRRAREMTLSLAGETARLSAENQSRAQVEVALERAVRVRDRFLDVLTEELSEPIAGLAVEIQSLTQKDGGGAGAGHNHARAGERHDDRSARIAALGEHIRRLGAVVEELKEVTRVTNRAAAVWDDIDLADVARQVTLRHRERLAAGGRGSTVSFRSEARIPGRWDRRRVEQLIANLLLNAGRCGAGQPIDVELTTDGGTAIISVRYRGSRPLDDDDDDEEATFAPRPRGRAAKPQAHHADMGLWVSHEIANAFGGSMSVRWIPAPIGSGVAPDTDAQHADVAATVITVELPRTSSRPMSMSASASAPDSSS